MGNASTTSTSTAAGRKVKIMKTNGEFFKLTTPAKVQDIIINYPGHILLDSDEFRRFSLRARPLDPEFDLQAKKIYLLVELPRFPSEEESLQPSASPVRVKVKLPKSQVERILQQSSDDSEAAGKIIDLCMDDVAPEIREDETTEKVSFRNLHPRLRIPYTTTTTTTNSIKYTKLRNG